jgi:MFS family permease
MSLADANALPSPALNSTRPFYGWINLAIAALAMVGTLPGRTQGLGLITEPLIRDLQIDRVAFAQINLGATLAGALFCLGVGRAIDRFGSRIVLTLVLIALGVVVLLMSGAQTVWWMIVLITLTRGFGQSALSVASLALVGKWFSRRLTSAMGVYALATSIGFMTAFPLIGAVTLARGWRVSWMLVALALLVIAAPLAAIFVRSTPSELGLQVDGDDPAPGRAAAAPADDSGATLGEALRSPAFWVFAIASSMYGLVASGVGLFNESILAERGFDPSIYHTTLAVTAITALAGNFAAGAFGDRGSLRPLLVAALALLTISLAALPHVSTYAQVMAYAVVMGLAGGFVMVVFFSFWGRAYGRRELGRIQGAAQIMTVLASAVGPLLLALCVRATGSYAAAFYTLAAVVAVLALAAGLVALPAGAAARPSVAR